jgi:cation:H+ antiporter
MLIVWGQFLLVAGLIAWSGSRVARAADALAESSGLGRVWMGAILVAAVTSLPELVTGLVAVTLANAPDLAVGDLFGSCVFNLTLLALVDAVYRGGALYAKLDRTHLVAAAYGLLMFALAGFGLATPASHGTPVVALVVTPVIAATYLLAARSVHHETRPTLDALSPAPVRADPRDVRAFVLWSLVVVASGTGMPFVASRLAEVMHWEQSFVGGLFVAASTSLPEIAVTLHAARIGAVDLAVGNLLGSNLFNLLLLGLDDLAWTRGPLLADVDPRNAVHLLTASAMTAVFIIGVTRRLRARRFGLGGGASWLILLLYFANAVLLYQREAAP